MNAPAPTISNPVKSPSIAFPTAFATFHAVCTIVSPFVAAVSTLVLTALAHIITALSFCSAFCIVCKPLPMAITAIKSFCTCASFSSSTPSIPNAPTPICATALSAPSAPTAASICAVSEATRVMAELTSPIVSLSCPPLCMSSSIFARSSCPCADAFSAADSLRYSFSSEAAACKVARSSLRKFPVEPFAIVSLYFLHAAATPAKESFNLLNSPFTAFAPSFTPCGSSVARYVMSVFAIAFQFL